MKEYGIFVIIIGLLIGGLVYASSQGVIFNDGSNPAQPKKYDLNCNVEVVNSLFYKSSIGTINCASEESGLFSLFSIISDTGNLQISGQGKSASVDYDVVETKSSIYKLEMRKLTAGVTPITATLYDDENKIISTKTISVNIGG